MVGTTNIKKIWTPAEEQALQKDAKKAIETALARKDKLKTTTTTKKCKPVSENFILDACNKKNCKKTEEWTRKGEEELRKASVAVVVLAGGQSSRLQTSQPKGTFELELTLDGKLEKTTPFTLLVKKLEKLNKKYQTTLPLVIMTSETTHDATTKFFDTKLKYPKTFFFVQESMPALKKDDLTIVKDKYKQKADEAYLAPRGNGDFFSALKKSGLLDKLRKELKIEWFHVISVDNILSRPADPVLLGAAIDEQSDAVSKVASVARVDESCGLWILDETDDKTTDFDPKTDSITKKTDSITKANSNKKTEEAEKLKVIEYSELPEELKREKPELTKNANLAMHLFSADFVEKAAAANLTWHLADKVVKLKDERNVEREEVRVWKLETFIFDAVPLVSKKPRLLLVERDVEFAPLKNLTGTDSPATVQEAWKKAQDLAKKTSKPGDLANVWLLLQ